MDAAGAFYGAPGAAAEAAALPSVADSSTTRSGTTAAARGKNQSEANADAMEEKIGLAESGGPLLYGASGGALVAAGVACRISYDSMMQIQLEVLKGCAERGTWGKVGAIVEEQLQCHLPSTAVRRFAAPHLLVPGCA